MLGTTNTQGTGGLVAADRKPTEQELYQQWPGASPTQAKLAIDMWPAYRGVDIRTFPIGQGRQKEESDRQFLYPRGAVPPEMQAA